MKLIIISALAILVLAPLAGNTYASCRDHSGPRGTYETCGSALP